MLKPKSYLKSGIKIISILLVVIILFICSDNLASNSEDNYIPKAGYVPDKETAIKIAEAIWLPIYGNEIYNYKPFIAELSKDKKIWKVFGTVHTLHGGSPFAEIRKSDCKVLKVIHEE